MVVYAENAGRRAMQVVADLTVTVITLVIWRGARATHDLVAALGAPGRRLADTGTRLGAEFNDFAEAVGATPLAGGALRAPIDALAGTSAAVRLTGVGAGPSMPGPFLVASFICKTYAPPWPLSSSRSTN